MSRGLGDVYKRQGIHPATGLIALLAGTELFGVWGALLAAPLAGLLQATAVALYLELRGGDPQAVLRAVAEQEVRTQADAVAAAAAPAAAPPGRPA